MRRLNRPIIDPAEIYDACVSGIGDSALAGRFSIARAEVIDSFQKFNLQASTNQLFSFIASARGKGEQQVLAGITKEEKIFERGYGKNTGLGLFLAREILSITGISIREAGIEGRGARFEMLVPKNGFRVTAAKGR